MKLFKKIISTALLCATATLAAQNCCPSQNDCNPCCDWFGDCAFSVFADYLYWDVCRSQNDLYKINQVPVSDSATMINLPTKYQSGYRVGGSIQMDCWNFLIRYASLDSSKRRSFPDEVDISDEFDYSVVDIDFGRTIYFNNCCAILTPFVGVKLGWIDETLVANVISDFQVATAKNNLSAYGVTLGANFEWIICDGCISTSFVTRGALSVLRGSFHVAQYDNVGFEPGNGFFDDACAINFVPEIYVGLDFGLFDCDCFCLNAQIGYEAQVWNSYLFLQPANFIENRASGTLGLNGLVARFEIGF